MLAVASLSASKIIFGASDIEGKLTHSFANDENGRETDRKRKPSQEAWRVTSCNLSVFGLILLVCSRRQSGLCTYIFRKSRSERLDD